MTFHIMFDGVESGNYMVRLCGCESKIELSVDSWSFEKFLSALMVEVPNDFRDSAYRYMVDCATKYFENHPIPEEEKEKFFELLGEIAEEDYEDGE